MDMFGPSSSAFRNLALGCNPLSILLHKLWTHLRRGEGETEERGRSLWIGKCSFKRPGNLLIRLSGGASRWVVLCITTGILQPYLKDLWVKSCIECSHSQRLPLSQDCVLRTASPVGMSKMHTPRVGKEIRSLRLPGSSFQVTWQSYLPNDLLQKVFTRYSLNHQNADISLNIH